MKVTTVEIIKVTMSMEEWVTIADMVKILENIYYDENPDSQKNIEKQWEKAGVNIDMGSMLTALEILRDLETEHLDTE